MIQFGGLVAFKKAQLATLARDMVKKECTVFPMAMSSYVTENPDPIRLWAEDEECLYVPRGYYWSRLKPHFDPEIIFNPSNGASELRPLASPVPPRPQQVEVLAEAELELRSKPFGGVILEMATAAGKSYSALELARRLGRKTLVVVHTTVLMEQWILEIKKFCPEWSIGKIQGKVCDIKGNDICVAMLHSVSLGEVRYPEAVFREFGTVIIDEVHLAAAKEFQKVFFRFSPHYFIGLTGTLKRADKTENTFIYGIGTVIKAMAKVQVLSPTVYFVDTKFTFKALRSTALDRQKNEMLAQLVFDGARNKLICEHAVNAAKSGRHVLVLSERVAHVKEITAKIQIALADRKDIPVALMLGETSNAEREIAGKAQVLVATAKLLSVGFNNPRLDTLIFATPIQEVYQSVGRILREHPEKKPPMVVDYYESTSQASMRLVNSRYKKYTMKRWVLRNALFIDQKGKQYAYGYNKN